MYNTTSPQESEGSMNTLSFMAYCVLMIVVTLAASAVIGITIVALGRAQSIPRPLRLFLVNLLVAGLFMGLGVVFIVGTSVVLVVVGPEHLRPPQYLCRVYMWMISVGAVARLWNLAAFALSILAIVRFGKRSISWCHAAVILTILWIAPSAICLYVLIPHVFEAHFVHGVACFPNDNSTLFIQARHTFFANWCLFGGLIPMTVSIAVPIICLCYIKKNTVTEDTQYRKAMAKFSLFLVLGGAINVAGQILPGAIKYYAEDPGMYLTYGFAAFSLLPTPIIIIAYLKPVQEQLKKIVTCGRWTKEAKDPKWTTSTPSSVESDIKSEKV